jgi:hypothetical protein
MRSRGDHPSSKTSLERVWSCRNVVISWPGLRALSLTWQQTTHSREIGPEIEQSPDKSSELSGSAVSPQVTGLALHFRGWDHWLSHLLQTKFPIVKLLSWSMPVLHYDFLSLPSTTCTLCQSIQMLHVLCLLLVFRSPAIIGPVSKWYLDIALWDMETKTMDFFFKNSFISI